MKAIVKDADALNPVLVAAFLGYAQTRGIFVDPARVRSPKDKPRVENQVPFVRESWFDGETFTASMMRVSALSIGAVKSPDCACAARRERCRASC